MYVTHSQQTDSVNEKCQARSLSSSWIRTVWKEYVIKQQCNGNRNETNEICRLILFFIIIFFYFYCKSFRKNVTNLNYTRWFSELSVPRVCFVLRVNSTLISIYFVLFNSNTSTDGNRLYYSHSYIVDNCLESKINSHVFRLKFNKSLRKSFTYCWMILLAGLVVHRSLYKK